MFNEFAFVRILHVVGVVLWIGGVAFVTTVLLPAVARIKTPSERVAFFESVEARFAIQARFTTLITGLSGFWLVELLGAWERFTHPFLYWWMIAMLAIWVMFTLMLFFLEPLFLHRWFLKAAEKNPEHVFRLIQRMHWVLLILSLGTVIGAVAGSHGWLIGW